MERNRARNMGHSTVRDMIYGAEKAAPKKNFQAEYRAKLKADATEIRQAKQEDETRRTEKPMKMQRFEANATSKFRQQAESIANSASSKRSNFLRKDAGTQSIDNAVAQSSRGSSRPSSRPSSEGHTPRQNRVQRKAPTDTAPPRARTAASTKNFVRNNLRAADASRPRSGNQAKHDFTQKRDFGKVPLYLQKRKMELAQIQRQKELDAEREKIPRGMRLMSEEERLGTVQLLQNNLAKTEEAVRCLPLTIETPSMIQKQSDLLERVKEIEDALKIFSRPKVFVQEDA